MKRILLSVALVALLSACGSSVKLNDVPVEDKTGTGVSQALPSGSVGSVTTTGATARTVEPVNLTKSEPVGVGPSAARVIYFDFDSYAIRPEFQPVVEAHAKYLAANKARKMSIEGHTDERGGREYNLALGQKRSEAVRSALGLLGVSDSQVEAVSFGKEKPADPGTDEAAMAKNRRAEMNYKQ